VKRLLIAIAAFAVLGVLAWTTLSDQRIRFVALAILAMFALKTWVRRHDAGPADSQGDEDENEEDGDAQA
jgi:membrane protein implicated in regulation of membrane protease activity